MSSSLSKIRIVAKLQRFYVHIAVLVAQETGLMAPPDALTGYENQAKLKATFWFPGVTFPWFPGVTRSDSQVW